MNKHVKLPTLDVKQLTPTSSEVLISNVEFWIRRIQDDVDALFSMLDDPGNVPDGVFEAAQSAANDVVYLGGEFESVLDRVKDVISD